MQSILEQITDWLKSMIISGIMGNLSGMFDSVNQQVGQIAGDVGTTPANFSPAVFSMIRNISESVILPIAGMVLTFIACYELIQMLIEHNNLANFETWTFFKWVFKTFLAVTLISNTFNITMAVFDVAQQVISRSGGLISGSTSVSDATLTAMQATLEGMDLGPLLGLYLQTFVVQVTMLALSAIIFVIVYGRMVEIYLMVSLAPIPFATFGNHEQSHTGQNYLRSLFALGFQGFLIMICVGIEADSFREKIWCLPASDLLGVGRATEKVLSGYGIHTIGELAATSDDFLKCRLGKNGLAIKKYANGLDDSLVMRSDYVSPVKSIGHGITTMQDLENNAEVWCVMLELVQEIGTKLRTHKKKAGGIAISIRNNELFTKEWQCRISIPTQSPTYLAKTAFSLFAKNYQWEHPIRSVTVRAINLFEEDCPIQYDLFTDVKSLDRQERLDAAIEQIRFRFGKDAIKNGVLFQKSKMPTERKVDLVMPTGMIG